MIAQIEIAFIKLHSDICFVFYHSLKNIIPVASGRGPGACALPPHFWQIS